MVFSDLFVFVLIAFSVTSAGADSIYGCGGFVEASSGLIKARKASDSKFDYSHITIELRTVDGLVRDRTQCAPNGYYFIPVYDKGSFVIKVKGPDGWSFDPDNVPVTVDQNGCNANTDINFHFTGFMISGNVKGAIGGESCSMKDGGPSDVKVDLLSPSDDLITSVFTSSVGKYSFSNVSPGKYKLSASHPNLDIEVRGTPEVNLGFGNVEVDDMFAVSGYNLQGSVVAQGNPILGVHVYLYSDDVSEVSCPQGVGIALGERNALCHAVTNADGKFTFHSLPCGSYELLPYYKGENTVFDVSPPSMVVSLEHQHLVVPQKFQVTGFSVGGRVVDSNGAGIDGVKIKVDGQQRATTDSQGYYKLDQVTSMHYSIVAEKEHYKFTALEKFQILPNMAYIKEIKAVSYDICGIVRLFDGISKAKVALTHGPENAKPQMKVTDNSGNFCFQVPAGEYRLSALAVDTSSSVLFSPPYVDIKVDRPSLDVEFSQAQVDIRGTVRCKEYCGDSTSVTLVRLSSNMAEKKKTIFLSEGSSDFTFTKIFPGKYRLEVKHTPSLQSSEDNWCWEQSSVELNVGSEDMEGIVFTQKGYWITIVSSHDTKAFIEQPDSSRVNLFIKRGSQNICVENPGEYEIHFVDPCIFFGSSSLKFNILQPMPVNLIGTKYLLKGSIHMDSSLLEDLSETIVVDIYDKSNVNIESINAYFVTSIVNQSGTSVYEYAMWADLGEEYTFVPRHSRDNQEKKILFYPRQRKVSVTVDGCQAAIPTIVGRMGLYLEGSVSPPLSGVDIKILADEASTTNLLCKGDLALTTKTLEDGSFVAGPLYDDSTYIIEASKPGYHVKKLGPNFFSCQKLGEIVVKIDDDGEAKELFPPVLLSLSGDDGYRNNSISGSGGAFSFDNLFPGNFYLRPLLKEYSFSPPTVAIELGSGESKVVIFHATRVAYSVMGKVTLLTGQPKEGVYVEARSESRGYYEEAKTDSAGNFRLRGLLPDTTYAIKVVSKDDVGVVEIERASPKSILVKIGYKDTKGVNFIVFEKPETTILSGHIEGSGLESLQKYLSVEIKAAGDASIIEAVIPVPLSNYFQIRDLPKSKHFVQLRSSLPSSTHKFESEVIEVDLEKDPQVHVGPIKFSIEEHHHKQELTAAPVFPLVTGLAVILLFISMPRLKDLYQAAIELATSASSTSTGKKETKKSFMRRRTY